MADDLKSSVDLAMEKMNQMIGKEKISLTDDQKKRIAEVRKEYEAKVAEKKILLAGDEVLVAELHKLTKEKEEKIEAIYKEAKGER
jgi:ribosomal protein S17